MTLLARYYLYVGEWTVFHAHSLVVVIRKFRPEAFPVSLISCFLLLLFQPSLTNASVTSKEASDFVRQLYSDQGSRPTLLLSRNQGPWDSLSSAQKVEVLHSVVCQGSKDLVELLISLGADPLWKNDLGETVLDVAIDLGKFEIAKSLTRHISCEGASIVLEDPNFIIRILRAKKKDLYFALKRRAQRESYFGLAAFGDLDEFKKVHVARVNSSLQVQDNSGLTALHVAGLSGNSSIVAFLLQGQVPPDALWRPIERWVPQDNGSIEGKEEKMGVTPLIFAIESGKVSCVRLLLRSNHSLSIRDPFFGALPLHWATKLADEHVVDLLLDAGADIDAKDLKSSRTACHWSVLADNGKCLSRLLSRGADPEILDADGRTALQLAILSRAFSTAKALIQSRRCDLHRLDCDGKSLLHLCAEADSVSIAKLLVKFGLSLSATDKNGNTLLQISVKFDSKRMISYLLKKGQNLNLFQACRVGDLDSAKAALESGIDGLNDIDPDGNTALILACRHGFSEIARVLIERGAILGLLDSEGRNCLHWAAKAGLDLVPFLARKNSDLCLVADKTGRLPVHWAVIGGHCESVESLLEFGSSGAVKDNDGCTPFRYSIAKGFVDIARVFILKGSNINDFGNGIRPLCVASFHGQMDSVKMLIERGAQIDACNPNGMTALHIAAKTGNHWIVEFLLAQGANSSIRDKNGWTALQYAEQGSSSACTLLLSRR